MEDDPNLLIILYDINTFYWNKLKLGSNDMIIDNTSSSSLISSTDNSISQFINNIIIYINIFLLLNKSNKLSFFIYDTKNVNLLLTEKDNLNNLSSLLINAINNTEPFENNSKLIAGLSNSLCHINNHKLSNNSRILIISASPITSDPTFLNCLYAAQSNNARIDICDFANSSVLKQACSLTSGTYLSVTSMASLLIDFVFLFLPNTNTLMLPTQSNIPWDAICYCHNNDIKLGYMCTACLTIYCTLKTSCNVCGVRIPLKKLKK